MLISPLKMSICAAINCYNGTLNDEGKTFHRFPISKPIQLEKWVSSMQRKGWVPTDTSVLCSDHFEESCFDQTTEPVTIKEGAIPTKFHFEESPQPEVIVPDILGIKVEDSLIPQIIDVGSLNSVQTNTSMVETDVSMTNIKVECPSPSSSDSSEDLKRKFICNSQQLENSRKKLKIMQLRSRQLKRKRPHFHGLPCSRPTEKKRNCRVSASANISRLIERHFPAFIPATKKKAPTRLCVVCCSKRVASGGKKVRKETRGFCPDCNVGLCPIPCFGIYHTQKEF